ncbi:LysR family transcriptional regulator [Psychrobacter aquimaris]|uniref:LysR family transcriptional regulator n=1 Tax=Psychrobacter aquimaris TaxID=292733 RepID=UPI003FD036A2
MFDIDIRLLRLFNSIYERGTISEAAHELNIRQPAASSGLKKLRQHFDDQLFVRVGHKMQPTNTARDMLPLVVEAIEKMRIVNEFSKGFDSLNASRTFRISMTDSHYLSVVPTLISYFDKHAPSIKLDIVPIDNDTALLMSKGEVDLVIGFVPQLQERFYQQRFFDEHYVVIANSENTHILNNDLSLELYQSAEHIGILPRGTGHYLIEYEIQKLNIKRNIVLRLPSHLGLGTIVQRTNLIATVPEQMGRLLQEYVGVSLYPLPFELPSWSIKQYWHEYAHHNADNQWLRQTCFNLLQS